ncbi:hypothetical protein JCM10212_002157 [Sporobolomyces blumeae]
MGGTNSLSPSTSTPSSPCSSESPDPSIVEDASGFERSSSRLSRKGSATHLSAGCEEHETLDDEVRNEAGEGKARDEVRGNDNADSANERTSHEQISASSVTSFAVAPTMCLICLEPCRPVSNPSLKAQQPSLSDPIAYGMFLGAREDGHLACIDCLKTFVTSKLEDGTTRAFPVHCFECSYELSDDDARRILGDDSIEGWHYRKLVESLPPLFCPNPACSARLVTSLTAATTLGLHALPAIRCFARHASSLAQRHCPLESANPATSRSLISLADEDGVAAPSATS